ncbi:MAG: Clp protease N-terminal domain-containing protein [Candidatus Colwellbacteria bacterium]|nr:Clp protease N-terminal domain-containing protein [Candidatus Colwellbacteria bacterium]
MLSFQRYTDRARTTIAHAEEEARLLNHKWIGPEHLLLALAGTCGHGGPVAHVFEKCGLSQTEIRQRILRFIGQGEKLPQRISFSPDARRVLGLAEAAADFRESRSIGVEHLLLALATRNLCVSEGSQSLAFYIIEEFAGGYNGVRDLLSEL